MMCFGIIQNNIALKLVAFQNQEEQRFGIIQNNIALKRGLHEDIVVKSFGIIQNNIALKQTHIKKKTTMVLESFKIT